MKKLIALFAILCLACASFSALAEITSADSEPAEVNAEALEPEAEEADTDAEAAEEAAIAAEDGEAEADPENTLEVTTAYRWFISQYRHIRTRKVSYYDNVYAVNHGEYLLQPFASTVPEKYFAVDDNGGLAVAPIVLDITDAMRERLYGADIGETAMFYGQYCERVSNAKGHFGYTGIHEGIDFVFLKDAELHAILPGVVTKAGDSNGTVGIYNEEYDCTLLYLHCQNICVKRGQTVEAGDPIANEGSKAIYNAIYNLAEYREKGIRRTNRSHYVHVELRKGRHTSSSPYRDVILQSDCPYDIMAEALGIRDSGRQPVTYAAIQEAQRLREEAEAQAKAEAEALARAKAEAEATPEPQIEIVEETEAPAGYGFADNTPTPEPAEAPEATLPPASSL